MLYYIYDKDNSLIGFNYNNDRYYYIKNLQGDIVGIIDSLNNVIASYEYDSWGNILSIKDSNGNEVISNTHIAIINPFRYRGYYYDDETGLYYLNSRYYNPEWCRFINADSSIGANQDILSYNLYLYVSNNPISCVDSEGNKINPISKKIIDVAKKCLEFAKKILTKENQFQSLALAASAVCSKNLPVSSSMLNTSLYKEKHMPAQTKMNLKSALKSNEKLNKTVDSVIAASNGSKVTKKGSIEFDKGDLLYSVGNVNYVMVGNRIDNTNKWDIDLCIWDKYNFDPKLTWRVPADVLNTGGLVYQTLGWLETYEWDACIHFVYKK